MAKSAPSLAGKLFAGRYAIEERLGWGRLGQVFLATHGGLGEQVALRVVPRRLEGAEALAFSTHLRAASRIDDQSLACIYDFGICPEGWPYVVSELIEGPSLAQELRRLATIDDTLGPQQTSTILLRLGYALRAAHAAGVAHLDLRPSNVVLTGEPGAGTIKVLDLGLAKALGLAGAPGPRPVASEARLSYTAPELRRGLLDDARADLYSLGVMAFEMLVGRPPLRTERLQQASEELRSRNATGPHRRGELPASLERLVLSCLDTSPDARPVSAAEVVELLLALPGQTLPPNGEGAMPVASVSVRQGQSGSGSDPILAPQVPPVSGQSRVVLASEALEELVLGLRDRGLASVDTTLRLAALVQNEDEVLRLEGEIEQLGTLAGQLENRSRQRSARLRRALAAVEHEGELLAETSGTQRLPSADAFLANQLDRRIGQLTSFLGHVDRRSQAQLGSLQRQIRSRQLRLLRRAGHAAQLRERLVAELRTIGLQAAAAHPDLVPLLRAARI